MRSERKDAAPDRGGRPFYYGWVIAATLGVTETVSYGVLFYAFSVFLQPMEAELGWSRGVMSGAFSLALLTSGVTAIAVGRWLDWHGPRLLMTVGSIAGTLLVLAWSQIADLTQFYLLWAAIGAVSAMVFYEPAFATVMHWFERKRSRAMAVVTLTAGFASTIFLPLAGWLVDTQGWRSALVTLAIVLGVFTILPHALVLRRRPADLGLNVDGEPPPEGAAGTTPGTVTGLTPGEAMREHSFWWLSAAFCFGAAVAIGVRVHFVAYLGERGQDVATAAALTGLIGAMQVVGRVLLGVVGDRVSARTATVWAMAIQALTIPLLFVPGLTGVLLFVVLLGTTHGAQTLLRPALVSDLYGRARYASIAGVLAFPTTVAQALGPLGVGVAHDYFGGYNPVLWVSAGLSVVAALCLARAAAQPAHPATTDARSGGSA